MNKRKIIGPLREDFELQKEVKRQPPPTAEEIEEQICSSKKLREAPEYQAKYNNKFFETGRSRRGDRDCWTCTEEDLRAIKEWNKFVDAWRKEHGRAG